MHSCNVKTQICVTRPQCVNIEARSCNSCCIVKAINITYSMCVCSLRYAHTTYCHLWSVRLYNIFPYYLINGTIFEGGGSYRTYGVFSLSLQLLSQKFLILRRTESDRIKNVHGCYVKRSLFMCDSNETCIFLTDFLKKY